MIPRIVIPEEQYLAEFRQYVFGLSLKWLGISPELVDPAEMWDRISETKKTNYRAFYLTYLLPLADGRYRRAAAGDTLMGIHKILWNMKLNGLPYNDFMLLRFCEIILRNADLDSLGSAPLPEDYKDLQKLIWTFVQQFRKKAAALHPIVQELV
ncbi:hypothetical protein B1A99_15900 [Cohnella sp. CIP 111063]|uniref:hypothetical protein n=1 Tax=unclassified Cohnella TaxID=2636738 RepID=UPI000B8C5D23|nr:MULTISPECIES: hypothetical protein [unclassified Cohnella]OXS57543.1 hypothetical protein B1A99_15900 [Cohnella sp. CIP 111063]PRX70920.1 hypothetical protein B0G52_1103 [Cohnella sp. SGD-V74]